MPAVQITTPRSTIPRSRVRPRSESPPPTVPTLDIPVSPGRHPKKKLKKPPPGHPSRGPAPDEDLGDSTEPSSTAKVHWDPTTKFSQSAVSKILTDTQSKSNLLLPKKGLMFPGIIAQDHPAGPMLKQWGTSGCAVDIVDDWTLEELDNAIAYGAHPSARTPVAAKALRTETLEKVHRGFATIRPWSELRQWLVAENIVHAKASPCAAIPHKSRLFRLLLDLSDKGQTRKGMDAKPSVNELTREETAPQQSMAELGSTLPRVIYHMATWPTEDGPVMMSKLDIKDGFWRVAVESSGELAFCYVLPPDPDLPDEDPLIVIPQALQMGWTSSPAYFCASTETGRDVAEFLSTMPELPEHPMEHHMVGTTNPATSGPPPQPGPATTEPPPVYLPKVPDPSSDSFHLYKQQFRKLYEVYVDDYIGLVQSPDPEVLRHHSRALLHAIHQIFPPVTGEDKSDDPISYKKLVLEGEGVWDTRKEILGWIFEGINRTMELPPQKLKNLLAKIKQILRSGHCERKEFESLVGKFTHAVMGIPGGSALLPPLYQVQHAKPHKRLIQIHRNSRQELALKDLRALFKVMSRTATKCSQLVPGDPDYIGFSDACKYGAGGCWLSGRKSLRPIVWRIKWPPEVVAEYVKGNITINDLEMAGLLLAYLILEQVVPDMKDTHTGLWADNTSCVSWTAKMNSGTSKVGQQLTRALAFRFCDNKASPLVPMHIAGKDNPLGDLPSRSFKARREAGNFDLDDVQFLTKFNHDFPLLQETSWLLLRMHTKISSLVFTLLCSQTLSAGSWLRLKKSACDIGSIGSTSVPSKINWTRFSSPVAKQLELHSLRVLPNMYVKGLQDEDIQSGMGQYRQRYRPSERSANWTQNGTLPTPKGAMNTTTEP